MMMGMNPWPWRYQMAAWWSAEMFAVQANAWTTVQYGVPQQVLQQQLPAQMPQEQQTMALAVNHVVLADQGREKHAYATNDQERMAAEVQWRTNLIQANKLLKAELADLKTRNAELMAQNTELMAHLERLSSDIAACRAAGHCN